MSAVSSALSPDRWVPPRLFHFDARPMCPQSRASFTKQASPHLPLRMRGMRWSLVLSRRERSMVSISPRSFPSKSVSIPSSKVCATLCSAALRQSSHVVVKASMRACAMSRRVNLDASLADSIWYRPHDVWLGHAHQKQPATQESPGVPRPY